MSRTRGTAFIHRPLPVRLLNGIGRFSQRLGWAGALLEAESLLSAAQKQTGLSDFGDPSFRLGLEKLLFAWEHDSQLTFSGRFIVREFCLGLLTNRLRLTNALKRHSAIKDEPIRRPIFVIGLPRTGTTLLHRLLAQDPAARCFYTWETYNFGGPHDPKTYHQDPRIEQVAQRMKGVAYMAPEMQRKHPIGATEPEECIALLAQTFISPLMFDSMTRVPSYIRWLETQDLEPSYRAFKTMLQSLQYGFPPSRWVLKSPGHLFRLDALLAVFPDACVIQTHRHPEQVIPSWCSLNATIRGMASDVIDPMEIGETWARRWARWAKRALEVRKTAVSTRSKQAVSPQFFDVYYQDLISDPIQTVRNLYEHFGYSYTADMEQRILRWQRNNQQHRHGIHRYSLEQFGLSSAQLETHFAAYLAEYFER